MIPFHTKEEDVRLAIPAAVLVTLVGCMHAHPTVRRDIATTVPDGHLEHTLLTRILDLDEKPDPNWNPSNSESVEVRGDTVWYRKVTYVRSGNRTQWREESAAIRLARTKASPTRDPLNYTDPDSKVTMSLPTWLLLRQIEMVLRTKEQNLRKEYVCSSKPIPPARTVRPHMAKALARGNYLSFEKVYLALERNQKLLDLADCSDDKLIRKAGIDAWRAFATEVLGLQFEEDGKQTRALQSGRDPSLELKGIDLSQAGAQR